MHDHAMARLCSWYRAFGSRLIVVVAVVADIPEPFLDYIIPRVLTED